MLLRKLKDELTKDNRVAVAKSLSVERSKTTVVTLIQAIFLDLASERDVQIPKQGEKRERDLRDLIKKQRKPVALIVDEAHDLHHKTLVGLKLNTTIRSARKIASSTSEVTKRVVIRVSSNRAE